MEQEVSLVFDLETNGLLFDASTIHCIAIHDCNTQETIAYNDTGNEEPVIRGVQRLADADCILGHNVIGYDIPVLRKLYPWFEPPSLVIDTLLLSRLYHTNLLEIDQKTKWRFMGQQLWSRHSLEAWGYRLGEYKGVFSKQTDWSSWSQEMEDYCIQDVNVTTKLWKHFHKYLNGSNSNIR